MMRMTCFVAVMLAITAQAQAGKEDLKRSVQSMAEESWSMARSIWEFAEPGYLETRSSALIADRLEKTGFKLARGVAGIPTAFTATYGSGKPVIAILGEYDALPELSQEAVPVRQPRTQGNGYGQACGHHLFGVGSMVAAIAVADEIRAGRLSGTVRYYGCPAEEGGAAKAFMVRAGLFSDVDCALHWHPGSRNSVGDPSCLARIAVRLRESISGKIPPMEDITTVYDNNGGTTMGSTDVGDVSWVVPTAGFSAACWAPGTPGHSWQAVACGGTTIGRKGMLLAADILAASAWDLIKNPALLEQAKVDFKRRLGESGYRPLMEKDQKPPLEYRLPARRNSSGE